MPSKVAISPAASSELAGAGAGAGVTTGAGAGVTTGAGAGVTADDQITKCIS